LTFFTKLVTQVASLISSKLGRTITHVKITEQQLAASMKSYGVPDDYADMLAQLDTFVSEGKEEILDDCVEKVTGKKPRTLEAFVDDCVEKKVWAKKD
jgi:festuclavine dehydrogenase